MRYRGLLSCPGRQWMAVGTHRRHTSNAATTSTSSAVVSGVVTEWHPFERRGMIVDGTGRQYVIPNTRSFETVLPTMLRDLKGAKVQFTPQASQRSPTSGEEVGTDRVRIRQRTDDIKPDTFRQPPPAVDLLKAFRYTTTSNVGPDAADSTTPQPQAAAGASPPVPAVGRQPGTASERQEALAALVEDDAEGLPWQRRSPTRQRGLTAPTADAPTIIAAHIVVDMASVPAPSPERLKEDEERTYLRDGIRPATHLKDLRSSTLLASDRLSALRTGAGVAAGAVGATGSTSAAATNHQGGEAPTTDGDKGSLTAAAVRPSHPAKSAQPERAPAVPPVDAAPVRTTDGSVHVGTVVAWSPLHRSGLVVLGAIRADAEVPVVSSGDKVFVIRNVEAFRSAMPSSLALVRRTVHFHAVQYSDMPGQLFAEAIEIQGALDYTLQVSDDVAPSKQAAKAAAKAQRLHAMVFETQRDGEASSGGSSGGLHDDDVYRANVPVGAVYGVLTRWSGGQGTIEVGNGRTYFVASAADFVQLVDQSSSAIRGAVVTFEVAADAPRYAKSVNLLSLSNRDAKSAKPMLPPTKRVAPQSQPAQTDEAAGETASSVPPPSEEDDVLVDEPEGVAWIHGFMVSWSPSEEQGIVQGDDGLRYLLKDAKENVLRYVSRSRHLLSKGRRVKFCRFGSSGLLACHVVPLEEAADEELLRKATMGRDGAEPKRTIDGNPDEAIASPLDTAYWMTKLERVGFDVSEVKNRQQNLVPPDLADDDDDPILDTKDVLSKDRWFNDKDRNIKVPGSEVRIGDLSQMAPGAMVNLAAKIRDPVKLEKMKDKYFNQLSEEMKEHAWKQAKEMAPRYAKRMREAKDKGEEPTFHFY